MGGIGKQVVCANQDISGGAYVSGKLHNRHANGPFSLFVRNNAAATNFSAIKAIYGLEGNPSAGIADDETAVAVDVSPAVPGGTITTVGAWIVYAFNIKACQYFKLAFTGTSTDLDCKLVAGRF